MSCVRIAIPTNKPGGLEAKRSDHFGHCEVFTLVDFVENKVTSIDTIDNGGHHDGGCMVPVRMLAESKVNAIVVGGMGKRPLQGCRELGIDVYFADKKSYQDVDSIIKGMQLQCLPRMEPEQACKGHTNCDSKES